MRGWIRDVRSYIEPVQIGAVMRCGGVGEVIKSNNHPHFKEGDFVSGMCGVQQYVCTDAQSWHKVYPEIASLDQYLAALGMPGMTAYFGILKKGEIKAGQTILVSGAAGAVGSIVGQIAKLKNCNVVGIAGGSEKCAYITENLGFDAAIDYKSENIYSAIKDKCPDGVDVYFDNVGGEILDAALIFINKNARIIICGAISQYNKNSPVSGPSNYLSLLVNRATMMGLLVFDYVHEYKDAVIEISQWMKEGKIKSRTDIYEGIENFNQTFLKLFSGNKSGKLILQVT